MPLYTKKGRFIMTVDLSPVFAGKKVILLGAGVSNMPLARMLAKMGASIEVRDKKTLAELGAAGEELLALGATLTLGDEYLSKMEGDFVFRSPGFRPDIPVLSDARERGICVTGEIEMFIEKAPCTVIGVTGSDGKSTTTTLISKILEESSPSHRRVFLGGNIGEPLLHRLCDMTENDIVAAELSSFQLMGISAPVTVAVIKNVTPNHLNWHTGMDEYIEAKAKILNGARRAVLNYDDEVCRSLADRCSCPVVWFSRKPIPKDFLCDFAGGVYPLEGNLVTDIDGVITPVVSLEDILLPGEHNAENYATAIAATLGYASADAVRHVAETFGGVRHRLELVRDADGVKYYNSSIDSSPTRTAAAISALSIPIHIICGGYDKNIPFEPLAEALIACPYIKTVVLTGATLEKIRESLVSHPAFAASGIKLLCEPDFERAVKLSASLAESGECVLLSPACASFDAFPNFEVRGERFKEIVNGL